MIQIQIQLDSTIIAILYIVLQQSSAFSTMSWLDQVLNSKFSLSSLFAAYIFLSRIAARAAPSYVEAANTFEKRQQEKMGKCLQKWEIKNNPNIDLDGFAWVWMGYSNALRRSDGLESNQK